MTLRHLALALLSFAFISTSAAETTEISGTAPDFTLKTLSGENIRLAEQRGKVVMLNFWATWCGPCREEMPLLEELQQRYQKAGFTVLGVNIEDTREAKKYKAVEHFAKEKGVTFPILLDQKKELVGKIEKLYLAGNLPMPTTIFIDRSGQVRYLHKGYKSGDKKAYKTAIKSLIRE